MFNFKTKKDKRIEYLENLLSAQLYKSPKIITENANTTTIGASVILEDCIPFEYAKREIARKFADELMDYIYFDVEDRPEECRRILKGYLRVIDNRF